jgi:hypothetical protein
MGAVEDVSVPRISEFVPVVRQAEMVDAKTNQITMPCLAPVQIALRHRQPQYQEQQAKRSNQMNPK